MTKISKIIKNIGLYANAKTMIAWLFSIFMVFNVATINAEESINDTVKNVKVSADKLIVEKVIEGELLSEHQLNAEQWELARSGESILSLPVLHQLVNSWLLDKNKKIQIQYPGGEEGELWVQQLTDWLVSLGIPSDHMVTAAGSGADDVIKFALIK